MSRNKFIQCRACGKQISRTANHCPHCGDVTKMKEAKHSLIFLAVILLLILWMVCQLG
jgi:predicted ATP-dependent serine protease